MTISSTRTLITIDPVVYRDRFGKLSHECKGFWLDLMSHGITTIPACEEQLGALLKCDVRKVRRLRDELVTAGILESRFGVKGAV
jgi:hypothetical protein